MHIFPWVVPDLTVIYLDQYNSDLLKYKTANWSLRQGDEQSEQKSNTKKKIKQIWTPSTQAT